MGCFQQKGSAVESLLTLIAGQTLERDSLLRRRRAEDRHGAGLRGPRGQVHQEEGGLREASEGGGSRAGDGE